MADLEDNIGHCELLTVHLIHLLLTVLCTIVESVLFIVGKAGIVLTVSAGIALGSAGIYLHSVRIILVSCKVSVIRKLKCLCEGFSVLFLIAQTVYSLLITVNEHIAGVLDTHAGSGDSVKRLRRSVIDTCQCLADIVDTVRVDQLLYPRSRKTPVTVDGIIGHCLVDVVVTTASDGTDMVQIVIVLKQTHQSGDTAFYRCLIDDACLGDAILGKRNLNVIDHNRHVSSLGNLSILPFAGQPALHLTVNNLSGTDGMVLSVFLKRADLFLLFGSIGFGN